MDRAPRAKVPEVEAARRQQVSWIGSHGAAVGEVPTYWLRVGADRLWAARPATSWEEQKTQSQQLGALDSAIRAAVGPAFDANEDRMHQALDEHHNELLRPVAELTLAPEARALAVTELSDLGSLRLVAIDRPLPRRQGAYLAALKQINTALATAEPTLWRAVYYSGLGSGSYVHFLGADRPLTAAQLEALITRALTRTVGAAEARRLLREISTALPAHELVSAQLAPELSTLPAALPAAPSP